MSAEAAAPGPERFASLGSGSGSTSFSRRRRAAKAVKAAAAAAGAVVPPRARGHVQRDRAADAPGQRHQRLRPAQPVPGAGPPG